MGLFNELGQVFSGGEQSGPAKRETASPAGKPTTANTQQVRGKGLDSEAVSEKLAGQTAKDSPVRLLLGKSNQRPSNALSSGRDASTLVQTHAYPLPFGEENRHMLFCGGTGSGKTRLFFQLFDQIQRRGDKAIIVDHGGEMIKRYYREGDIVFNPCDARFPGWSPFNEIREQWHHDTIGRMVIPDGSGDQAEWHGYAQNLFASISERCEETGLTSNAELLRMLTVAGREELHAFLDGDPMQDLFSPGNERLAGSVRFIVSKYVRQWKRMRSGPFSLRDWVLDDNDRRWVFITYKDSMYPALRSFIGMAISLAITYGLDLDENENRRIWFALDEMASLDKSESISEALAKIRKRGGCVVAGIQTISQLREKNGADGAMTLLSNFSTKVALRTLDVNIAEEFSKFFGEIERWHQEYSDGMGFGGNSGGNMNEGVSTKLKTERVVTPTELMRLPDLQGFVQFPGGLEVAEIDVPVLTPPNGFCAEPFIPAPRR